MNITNVSSNQIVSHVQDKIKDIRTIVSRVAGHCLFTKGVFDLVHYGHLSLFSYIHELKRKQDLEVVVGVTSDKLVKIKKGNTRPINSEMERSLLIALLPQVDYVYIHDHENYVTIIEELKPRIYIKGMDTVGSSMNKESLLLSNPEFELMHNESEIVVFMDDGNISSSKIIDRIKSTNF